jgi:hypothetical protein
LSGIDRPYTVKDSDVLATAVIRVSPLPGAKGFILKKKGDFRVNTFT